MVYFSVLFFGFCLFFYIWFFFFDFLLLMEFKIFSYLNFEFLNFFFLIDGFNFLFFALLLLIVASVFLFSLDYLEFDFYYSRFMMVLLGFVLSMVYLLFFPGAVFFLIGWDGLGVTSFLLMCYYYSHSSWSSSIKTYLLNRLGDAMILSSLLYICKVGLGYLGIFSVFSWWVSFFFILGLVTKSAQWPFSSWLPAAMAAPTPVSALVHSSTLVTAGIYMMFRFNIILFNLGFLFYMSMWTLLISSVSACFEFDLKKIIALSTLSQLGLICVSLSLGNFECSMVHLFSHASFKALMFIMGGYMLLLNWHFQDLRFLSFSSVNFFFISVFIGCNLSLSGIFCLSGFISKEGILEMFSSYYSLVGFLIFVFCLTLTPAYTFRLIYYLMNSLKFSVCNKKNFLLTSRVFSYSFLFMFGIFFTYFFQYFFFYNSEMFLNFKIFFGNLIVGVSFFSLFIYWKVTNTIFNNSFYIKFFNKWLLSLSKSVVIFREQLDLNFLKFLNFKTMGSFVKFLKYWLKNFFLYFMSVYSLGWVFLGFFFVFLVL